MTVFYVSEWSPEELEQMERCFCACHAHPGTYPTTEHRGCSVCGHKNQYGYFPGSVREGWVEYWMMEQPRSKED
jgi:hypothetical protein